MEVQEKKILLVEDEDSLRSLLTRIITLEGYKVYPAVDATEGLEILRRENILVVVTDVKLPDINGIELTERIKASYPGVEVVVLTAFSNVKDGVKAMKIGAFDYMTKGEGDEKLPLVIKKAMEKAHLNRQLFELEQRLDSKSNFAKIIGKSPGITKTIELAKKVAVTDTTVLILGETGTGKELLAEAIHMASRRRKGPFIPINCAAIPKDLQESELFGHKKGAFTGASHDKKGYFEVADRGTIFLDELGEMSGDLQAKLLRALESRIINRVGDTEPIPIDVRIIAATNRDLINGGRESEFRKDLYYRLSTFTIDLPPLRERHDDIELLALHFMKIYAEKNGRNINNLSPGFSQRLLMHGWPGNIRELKNVIERAVILAESNTITEDLLPSEVSGNSYFNGESVSNNLNDVDLRSIERNHILKVLDFVKGNKSEAAKKLDIGLATLYRKLKEYGLET
ncbi:MAG TPA: sigma-54 dependent transcriptional regulator [Cytophagales bacterium]|nr:sigma-54 dependent transcriptional regulator [Cytophagales bacterium]